MKSLHPLDELDRLLGEACSDIDEAAANAIGVGSEREKAFKRILADALVRVWDARDIIHAQRPDLKPEFAREAEADPSSHAAYLEASLLARRLGSEGKSRQAVEVLSRFAASATSTYFAQTARQELAAYGGAV
jgi:hypothetical protein